MSNSKSKNKGNKVHNSSSDIVKDGLVDKSMKDAEKKSEKDSKKSSKKEKGGILSRTKNKLKYAAMAGLIMKTTTKMDKLQKKSAEAQEAYNRIMKAGGQNAGVSFASIKAEEDMKEIQRKLEKEQKRQARNMMFGRGISGIAMSLQRSQMMAMQAAAANDTAEASEDIKDAIEGVKKDGLVDFLDVSKRLNPKNRGDTVDKDLDLDLNNKPDDVQYE